MKNENNKILIHSRWGIIGNFNNTPNFRRYHLIGRREKGYEYKKIHGIQRLATNLSAYSR